MDCFNFSSLIVCVREVLRIFFCLGVRRPFSNFSNTRHLVSGTLELSGSCHILVIEHIQSAMTDKSTTIYIVNVHVFFLH
jgi:hypothetical protein